MRDKFGRFCSKGQSEKPLNYHNKRDSKGRFVKKPKLSEASKEESSGLLKLFKQDNLLPSVANTCVATPVGVRSLLNNLMETINESIPVIERQNVKDYFFSFLKRDDEPTKRILDHIIKTVDQFKNNIPVIACACGSRPVYKPSTSLKQASIRCPNGECEHHPVIWDGQLGCYLKTGKKRMMIHRWNQLIIDLISIENFSTGDSE